MIDKSEHIVFIDDKLRNIKDVEEHVKSKGLMFSGLRYAGCDNLIKLFNKELAIKELNDFLIKYPFNVHINTDCRFLDNQI